MQADGVDGVIGLIYEAAAEPERWPAALSALRDLTGAWAAQFFLWDERRGRAPFSAMDREERKEGDEAYARYYGAIDPRRRLLDRLPPGAWLRCHEHFDDGYVRRSEFYQDFLIPAGARYVACARLLGGGGLAAVAGVLRDRRQGPFGASDMPLLERLAPHLQRAAHLHHRLAPMRRAEGMRREALDRLPFGLLVVDVDGRVLTANRAAERMAAAGDGLLVLRGRVTTARPDEAAALALHVARAAATAARRNGDAAGGAALRLTRPSGRAPYAVLVAPLAAADPFGLGPHPEPAALALVTDPARRPAVLGRHLVELFGLTPAEARLAAELAVGATLADHARAAGVSLETARRRLERVQAKTGAGRQADLVALVLGSAAALDA